jgi:hypothetical protein
VTIAHGHQLCLCALTYRQQRSDNPHHCWQIGLQTLPDATLDHHPYIVERASPMGILSTGCAE